MDGLTSPSSMAPVEVWIEEEGKNSQTGLEIQRPLRIDPGRCTSHQREPIRLLPEMGQ